MGRPVRYPLVLFAALIVLPCRSASAQQTPDGWITDWLQVPTITRELAGNAPPFAHMRQDFITDGTDVFESTFLPLDIDEVEPDFGGASPAIGFVDPLVEPVVVLHQSLTDTIDIAATWGESIDSVSYNFAYVEVGGDAPVEAFVELGSDDSVQVKIDDCEAFIRSIGRGCGGAGEVQDRAPVTLTPGPHRVLVKVFQGGGGYCFRLRLTDAEGTPLTPDSDPPLEVSTDPDDLGLAAIDPVGIALGRTLSPDVLPRISEENSVEVTLSATKLYPLLDDATAVTVTEVLPAGVAFVAATPPPTAQNGQELRWDSTVGAVTTAGITYTVEIAERGTYSITGTHEVGAAGVCSTFGGGTVTALDLAGILLGDLVGGGLGTAGAEPPPFAAVNIDTGLFMSQAEVEASDGDTMDTDGLNPAEVIDSDVIDSVFFINDELTDIQIINTAGVEYQFIAGDAHGVSWNGILSNVTHDRDKGVGNIFVGGQGGIATGVGVHASAGITFDLAGMRTEYGADNIEIVTGMVGMDTCAGGTVNNYIIFSDGSEVFEDEVFIQNAVANSGEFVALLIPPDATFMTFAAGDAGNGIGCDHGVFGDMRVLGLSEALLPPTNATCTRDGGNFVVTWDHIGSTELGFTITANGAVIENVAGGTSEVTFSSGELPQGVVEICISNSEGETCCSVINGDEVFVNCGGPRLENFVDGRTWEADSAASPSPFLVSGANTADFSLGLAAAFRVADTSLVEPEFMDNPAQSRLFATERWADGDVVYRFPMPPGNYQVTLLFAEGCCSDGCEDIDDPALSLGGCRVFDLEVNGALVADQFSQHVEAQLAIGNDLPNANWGVALAKGPYRATVAEGGSLEVRVVDLGAGSPPENASIKGIAIEPAGDVGVVFKRGDADGVGGILLTDGVYLLNFLFLGGPAPPCADAADVNDDGRLDITTAVFLFNFLFLGGPQPPDPATASCGADPTQDDLDCAAYDNC